MACEQVTLNYILEPLHHCITAILVFYSGIPVVSIQQQPIIVCRVDRPIKLYCIIRSCISPFGFFIENNGGLKTPYILTRVKELDH